MVACDVVIWFASGFPLVDTKHTGSVRNANMALR